MASFTADDHDLDKNCLDLDKNGLDLDKNGHDFSNYQVSIDSDESPVVEAVELRVYKRRWFMLFVVAFLNLSNGALWINFAPITNATQSFFGNIDSAWVDALSLVFFLTTIPLMFLAMWVTDKKGFKLAVQLGCILNFFGALIRLFGTFDFVSSSAQYPITLVGQTVASLAQPFAMSLPTKVSEIWFPERERSFSTALCAVGNPIGFMLGNMLSPVIVKTGSDLPVMNEIFCTIGMVAGLFGLLVWEAKPPYPPSNTGSKLEGVHRTTYCADLRDIFVNKDYVILMLGIGGGMGLVSALQTMIGQMICTFGYDATVAGLCGALMVVGGLFGAALFSVIAERTKKLAEITVIGFSVAVLLAIVLILTFNIRNIEGVLIAVCVVLGFFAVGVYPVTLEVGVECTYPVDESLSTGVIVVAGQLLGAIFIIVMGVLGQPPSAYDMAHQVCTVDDATDAYDMTYSGIFLVGVASVLAMSLSIWFRPKYLRREAEKLKIALASTGAITSVTTNSTTVQSS